MAEAPIQAGQGQEAKETGALVLMPYTRKGGRSSYTLASTHDVFQGEVLKLAYLLGWKHYHTYNSKHSPPGWPDLVLIRAPRLIFVELKTPRYPTVTSDQRWWLDNLAMCGHETYVWKAPGDWESYRKVLT